MLISDDSENGEYKNLKLNCNHQNLSVNSFFVHSKTETTKIDNKNNYDFTDKNDLKAKKDSNLWSKYDNDSLNSVFNQKENEFKNVNENRSTLSFHISAYKNGSNNIFELTEKSKQKSSDLNGFIGFASIIQNPFEFPRQENEGRRRESDISQFKTSQRLINLKKLPNNNQHGIFTHIVQQNDNKHFQHSSLGFGISSDNFVGSEQALLERFNIPSAEKEEFEKGRNRTKKFIIELLHLHWYHETNRIVVTESRLSNGYKLANELLAQNDLKAQQFLELSRRQSEKIVDLQNQLENERRKFCALENRYKLIKPDAEKITNPTVDISGLNGLFSITLLNSPVEDDKPCYKTCAFGELDEGGPIFDERDESLRPHLGGGWHHPQISPLIDEPIHERRTTKIIDETISNTGLNCDVMLNFSTITAAAELEHPAAKIGRKH
uniref:Uncharacterized protein n=1 Tax=Panagrolaimus sp. PS1159 TaxID=55785 RepID=A0AC35FZ49_9BILA